MIKLRKAFLSPFLITSLMLVGCGDKDNKSSNSEKRLSLQQGSEPEGFLYNLFNANNDCYEQKKSQCKNEIRIPELEYKPTHNLLADHYSKEVRYIVTRTHCPSSGLNNKIGLYASDKNHLGMYSLESAPQDLSVGDGVCRIDAVFDAHLTRLPENFTQLGKFSFEQIREVAKSSIEKERDLLSNVTPDIVGDEFYSTLSQSVKSKETIINYDKEILETEKELEFNCKERLMDKTIAECMINSDNILKTVLKKTEVLDDNSEIEVTTATDYTVEYDFSCKGVKGFGYRSNIYLQAGPHGSVNLEYGTSGTAVIVSSMYSLKVEDRDVYDTSTAVFRDPCELKILSVTALPHSN